MQKCQVSLDLFFATFVNLNFLLNKLTSLPQQKARHSLERLGPPFTHDKLEDFENFWQRTGAAENISDMSE